ncbi:PatB family C-S lyase [Salinicola sp. JS01]|uniref:MalY/PatB family protein n=1 Tax=Salinicola sp. JS01 TaxID=3050071 RepID=UPI00255C1A74|nr:PatB family C-S lyase [Salinicola sp. JS01]WIX33512.1 PatB family C-S lyase [Salinicola sp. JS01]
MSFDFATSIDRRQYPTKKWQQYAEDVLPLWVADMDFRSPPAVIEALNRRVDHGVFGYADATPALRDTLCRWSERHYGWSIDPAWQCWVPGVVPALHLAALAFSEPGEGVLTATPIYPPFLSVARHTGREAQTFELAPPTTPGGDWRLDLEALETAIRPSTRVLLWCHPHNPTGRVWDVDELRGLAELAQRHGLIVVSDELHCDLILDPERPHQPLGLLCPDLAERLITLWAPSKTFNIAGLSAACAVIADASLRQRFQRAATGLLPGVNVLGLHAAEAAYADGEAWRQALLEVLRDNLARLERHVAGWSGVALSSPQSTYLAWLDLRASAFADSPQQRLLEEARVALSDGADFGWPGFVRLNFGTPSETLGAALGRLDRVLG